MKQQVLTLFWIYNMSFEGIAKATGCTLWKVKDIIDSNNKPAAEEFFVIIGSKLNDI